MPRLTLIERAYEMGRSGDHASLKTIEKALEREGYFNVSGHLSGKAFRTELGRLCRDAQGVPVGARGTKKPLA